MDISELASDLNDELVAFRRDLHACPETGRAEVRTTARLTERLRAAGMQPKLLPGTGLIVDLEPSSQVGPARSFRVGLRADLDALPLADETGTGWASTVPGVSHACGHDVHTTVVLGAGLVLAQLQQAGHLPCQVRLIFQPAEEQAPGGALDVIAAGGVDGVDRMFAVHCDPHVDVGQVGLRVGAITSASDHVLVTLTSVGGHTSRPHLTGDLVYALGQVITTLPAVLNRRVDPRSGVSLVWGRVSAGGAYNAIPSHGEVEGTLRVLQHSAWQRAGHLLEEVIDEIVAPFAVTATLQHTQGVPPTVNDELAVDALRLGAFAQLGPASVIEAEQSLGGEDFGWYLERVPGALARLGTRTPGGTTFDLHRGDYEPDERAIQAGVRLLVGTVLAAAGASRRSPAPVVRPTSERAGTGS